MKLFRCLCGCGVLLTNPKKGLHKLEDDTWVHLEDAWKFLPLCKCGCGKPVLYFTANYLPYHHLPGRKPWNTGKTVEDPRVKDNIEKCKQTKLSKGDRSWEVGLKKMQSQPAWNLNLTAETDARVKKYTNKLKGRKPSRLPTSYYNKELGHYVYHGAEEELCVALKRCGFTYLYEKEIKLHGSKFDGCSYYPDVFVDGVYIECKGRLFSNSFDKVNLVHKMGLSIVVLTYKELYETVVGMLNKGIIVFTLSQIPLLLEKLHTGELNGRSR